MSYIERITDWTAAFDVEIRRRIEDWSEEHLGREDDPTPADVDAIAPQVLASSGWRPEREDA